MSRDKNVALVRKRFEELDCGNFDVLDELFSPSYELHPVGDAKPLSLDETKALYRYLYRAFPGLKHEISEQFVDGDKVVTIWSATGEGGGGQPVTFGGINVYTIDDGKFVRSDVSWDLSAAIQPGGESVFEAARGG